MEEVDATDDRLSQQSAIRSYRFLAGTILLVINVIGGAFILFKHLDYLPFGAVGCLIAGLVVLVSSWRFTLRRREHISLLLAGKNESSKEKSMGEAFSFSMDVLENGMLLANIVAMMFLATVAQVLSGR